MDAEVEVVGLECDSCAKAVSRVAANSGASVKSIDYSMGRMVVEIESQAQLESLKKMLVETGYGVDGNDLKRGLFSRPLALLGKLFSDDPAFAGERSIVQSSLLSLFAMLAITAFAAFIPVSPAFLPLNYVPLLTLAAFGTAACSTTLSHYRAFTEPFSCMSGMMIGMTIGMMGGFLAGALAGAANGMFVGSLAGMGIGMVLGAVAGKRTGVMGVLEGLMAGLMAGTMGAMLSVMLFNDNVVLFLTLLFAACTTILVGLSYMMVREGGNVAQERTPTLAVAVASNLLFFAAFSALLVLGPKSAFAWTGAV